MEMMLCIQLLCLLLSGFVVSARAFPSNICYRSYSGNYTIACVICSDCSNSHDCINADCMSQQCADFVESGGCCNTCPNGPNCWVESSIVPFGRVVSFANGTECSCIHGNYNSVRTQCRTADGALYFHGPKFADWM